MSDLMLHRPLPRSLRVGGPGRRHQSGAIGLMAAVVMLTAMMLAALSLDAGRLWMERRSLQKAADMSAMAAARFTGCGGSLALVQARATNFAKLNGLSTLGTAEAKETVTANHGYLSPAAGGNRSKFNAVAADQDGLNAVQVTVTREVPASLVLGGLWGGTTVIAATATATGKPPTTMYMMGSSYLTIDNAFTRGLNTLFETIFPGSRLSLQATGLQKLAAATIDLEALRRAGNFSSIDALLDSEMTIAELLAIYQRALANGSADVDATRALGQLLNAADPAKNKDAVTMKLKLKDILSNNTGDRDALINAQFNLLDLIKTSILVAAQQSDYQFENSISVLGFTFGTKINAVPKPTFGPGGRSAETGNWCTKAQSTDSVWTFAMKLPIPLVTFDLALNLNVGNATASVDYVDPSVAAAKVNFEVNTTPMSMSVTSAEDDQVPGFVGLSIPWFGTNYRYGFEVSTAGANNPVEAPTEVLFQSPTPVAPMFKAGSSETQGALAGMLNSALRFKPVGLPKWLEALVPKEQKEQRDRLPQLIMDTLGNLLANTIDPLLRALGVNFGSADIMLYDIQSHPSELVDVQV